MGKLGIICGSGFEVEGDKINVGHLLTPFGNSGELHELHTEKVDCVILKRHGEEHQIPPHKINNRANIYALKYLGVTQVVDIAAVGSLKKEIKVGDVVVVDQFIDKTKQGAEQTFFNYGTVIHVPFLEPVCADVAWKIRQAALLEKGVCGGEHSIWAEGTYLSMEGPAFSTRAEVDMYRTWGATVIGMTNIAEAKLAREAEMCFNTLAMVTDKCPSPYWFQEEVTMDAVKQSMVKNSEVANRIVKNLVNNWVPPCTCACSKALEKSVATKNVEIRGDRFWSLMQRVVMDLPT